MVQGACLGRAQKKNETCRFALQSNHRQAVLMREYSIRGAHTFNSFPTHALSLEPCSYSRNSCSDLSTALHMLGVLRASSQLPGRHPSCRRSPHRLRRPRTARPLRALALRFQSVWKEGCVGANGCRCFQCLCSWN